MSDARLGQLRTLAVAALVGLSGSACSSLIYAGAAVGVPVCGLSGTPNSSSLVPTPTAPGDSLARTRPAHRVVCGKAQ
jgi:hypothetical protein